MHTRVTPCTCHTPVHTRVRVQAWPCTLTHTTLTHTEWVRQYPRHPLCAQAPSCALPLPQAAPSRRGSSGSQRDGRWGPGSLCLLLLGLALQGLPAEPTSTPWRSAVSVPTRPPPPAVTAGGHSTSWAGASLLASGAGVWPPIPPDPSPRWPRQLLPGPQPAHGGGSCSPDGWPGAECTWPLRTGLWGQEKEGGVSLV